MPLTMGGGLGKLVCCSLSWLPEMRHLKDDNKMVGLFGLGFCIHFGNYGKGKNKTCLATNR